MGILGFLLFCLFVFAVPWPGTDSKQRRSAALRACEIVSLPICFTCTITMKHGISSVSSTNTRKLWVELLIATTYLLVAHFILPCVLIIVYRNKNDSVVRSSTLLIAKGILVAIIFLLADWLLVQVYALIVIALAISILVDPYLSALFYWPLCLRWD